MDSTLASLSAGLWALGAGLVLPGWLVVRGLGLRTHPDAGTGILEALVIAVAIGRVGLSLAALALGGLGALSALHAWPALAILAGLGWGLHGLRAGSGRRVQAPDPRVAGLAIALLGASWLLVDALTGRSGQPDASGSLLFFGMHTTNDPLVYRGIAGQLAQGTLPVVNPYAAGVPALGHSLWFGELAALEALGLGRFESLFFVRPLFDTFSLAATVVALTRSCGGTLRASALAGFLLLFGGGLSAVVASLAEILRPVALAEIWSFGEPVWLPVTTTTAGLQTALAALLLVRGDDAGLRRPVLAGLLVAATFEQKAFLWPAFAGAACLAAIWMRSGPLARPARVMAVTSVAAGLVPVGLAMLRGRAAGEVVGASFDPCLGCLPRYLLRLGLGDRSLMPGLFQDFAAGDWLRPGLWLESIGAIALFGVVYLGVRILALPRLVALARRAEPDRAWRASMLLGAALLGFGATCLLAVAPHYPNTAQLAAPAVFALWPGLGLLLDDGIAGRRWVRVGAVLLLAVASPALWIRAQGPGAPLFLTLTAGEQRLLEELAARSRPGEVVLEPSLVAGLPVSPVPVWTGRSAFASRGGMLLYLVDGEEERRREIVGRVFQGARCQEIGEAVVASGAGWIYAPAPHDLACVPMGVVEVVRNPSGAIYRVGASRSEPGVRAPARDAASPD